MMRVFIGMETSGRSRRAFAARGHDVISCDIRPQDDEPGVGLHIVGDVMETLRALRKRGWWPDFALFHPTCTYLTWAAEWAYADPDFERYPGVGYHQKIQPGTLVGAARREARVEALQHCAELVALDIPRIVLENPAGAFDAASPGLQSIQPFMFGDDASKETHLHLVRTLPLRIPHRSKWATPRLANAPIERDSIDFFGHQGGVMRWDNQTDSGQNAISPHADRWKQRSETYPGLANAFAENWG